MKFEITMNEKQIKKACLEFIQEKFHGLKMEFDIKSLGVEDGEIKLKVIGDDLDT
jgi:hypothetical protein